MSSEKDRCFEKAVDKINEGREAKGQQPLDVKHQQAWVRDVNGSWTEATNVERIVYSIRKTLGILKGDVAPRADGAANPHQLRFPDATVTNPDGSKVMLDNKFTQADGKPDPWRTKEGMSGTKQREDYTDFNKKQGNDVGDEPKLDKDNCDCGKRKLETEKVQVRVPQMEPGSELYMVPSPSAPGLANPSLPPIRVPPIRVPIPIFP